MEALVIDNYESPNSSWFHKLKSALKRLGNQYEVRRFDDEFLFSRVDQFDAIVLSGSETLLSEEVMVKRYQSLIELVQTVPTAILGICFGHQIIGIAFGSRVVHQGMLMEGYRPVKIVESEESPNKRDPLFYSLPDTIQVMQAHYEVIESLPKDFKLLAYSNDTAIEAMVHKHHIIYGIQFHAECYTSEKQDGKKILQNFFNILKK
ncbi:MAG: gamma-glutamyl-gamma-aminobutyrate hydrolase family protein [Candidatus Heimdallarchaeota archaeon]